MPPSPDPWRTFPAAEHEVLVVVRSVPAAGRLLDAVHVFDGDDRVELTFALNPGSVSEPGVEPMLRAAGVQRIIGFDRAVAERERFSLALAASPKEGLHRLRPAAGGPPLLLMPHGAGHNRLVGAVPGDLETASGLAPGQLLHAGRALPAALALSHTEQADRLPAAPALRGVRAEAVGDISFDRMSANEGRRDRFREALRIPPGHRLIAVSSTWNRDSLLGSGRDAVRRLLAALPADSYRVALIAHPNVWCRHGPHGLRRLLSDEQDAGLVLVDPYQGWRAALVAADAVVGDHGSTTYYAAALGRPVLLAAFGGDELDPASPLHAFARRVPFLGPGDDPRRAVEAALDAPPPDARDLLIAHPGSAAERLRGLCYSLLGAAPPAGPAALPPLPDPEHLAGEATAWRVAAAAVDVDRGAPVLRPALHPAAVSAASRGPLLVSTEDTVPARRDAATALLRPRPAPEAEAVRWAREALDRHPLCSLAAAVLPGGEYLLALADGPWLRLRADGPAAPPEVAAAATAWLDEDPALTTWREKGAVLLLPQGGTRLQHPPPA
ncbi:hypothetical protein J0910_07805 [Nocardiopsis sp. CNT-189]|uniref:hypothetical protein n=1 Tax=Nocardiopsis oceanisediminis TaxID=2816862 RepID=UPI003B302ACD